MRWYRCSHTFDGSPLEKGSPLTLRTRLDGAAILLPSPLNLRSEGASRRKAALLFLGAWESAPTSTSTASISITVPSRGPLNKWVDVAKLCLEVLPGLSVNRIRYFTALIKSTPVDPHMTSRQQFFIRALETIPNLSVHYGHFLESTTRMRVANPPIGGPATVQVVKMEEKGSDVNIATYMLVDAFRGDCDQLIVVTNDSDLAEPVRIINKELNIPVGIFNPHSQSTADCQHRINERPGSAPRAKQSITLRKVAKFSRDIREEHLAAAQFPDVLTDAQGKTVKKPAGW